MINSPTFGPEVEVKVMEENSTTIEAAIESLRRDEGQFWEKFYKLQDQQTSVGTQWDNLQELISAAITLGKEEITNLLIIEANMMVKPKFDREINYAKLAKIAAKYGKGDICISLISRFRENYNSLVPGLTEQCVTLALNARHRAASEAIQRAFPLSSPEQSTSQSVFESTATSDINQLKQELAAAKQQINQCSQRLSEYDAQFRTQAGYIRMLADFASAYGLRLPQAITPSQSPLFVPSSSARASAPSMQSSAASSSSSGPTQARPSATAQTTPVYAEPVHPTQPIRFAVPIASASSSPNLTQAAPSSSAAPTQASPLSAAGSNRPLAFSYRAVSSSVEQQPPQDPRRQMPPQDPRIQITGRKRRHD